MSKTHTGIVALVGLPNAGKSTLVNRLVGQKVSIVTPKAQTTRFRVRGVCMEGETQIILTDTPGLFFDKADFSKAMFKEAEAGLDDADAILIVVDASKPTNPYIEQALKAIFKRNKTSKTTPPACNTKNHPPRLRGGQGGGTAVSTQVASMPPLPSAKRSPSPPQAGGIETPVALVLNKVDIADKAALMELAQSLSEKNAFEHVFMTSALTKDGVQPLLEWLTSTMPEGPYLYDPEEISDLPMRHMAAEVTREHCFKLLQQEIPYGIHVLTEHWEDKSEKLTVISQLILVEKEGHKKLVIGKQGGMLKKIGIRARSDLEKMLEKKVHLDLHVKVDARWQEKMVRLGLHPEQFI